MHRRPERRAAGDVDERHRRRSGGRRRAVGGGLAVLAGLRQFVVAPGHRRGGVTAADRGEAGDDRRERPDPSRRVGQRMARAGVGHGQQACRRRQQRQRRAHRLSQRDVRAGDRAVGCRDEGVDLGAGALGVDAFEAVSGRAVEHRTRTPAVVQQAPQCRCSRSPRRRPPDLEVVLGAGEGDVQQPQRVAVDLEFGELPSTSDSLARLGAALGDAVSPRHPRGDIDHAAVLVVEHVRPVRRRSLRVGEGHQHHRVFETFGRVHGGDVHGVVVGLDTAHRRLGLVVGVGDHPVERVGHRRRFGRRPRRARRREARRGGRGR